MNMWLSSSANHQWNPSQKTPATEWEAEIDRQMQLQASSPSQRIRKQAVDRVQQTVADQQPFIYLVYPNVLQAISPQLRGVQASILSRGLVWNIDSLRRDTAARNSSAFPEPVQPPLPIATSEIHSQDYLTTAAIRDSICNERKENQICLH